MEIIINNAILHVVENNGNTAHISNEELDIDSDTCYSFVQKHVKKLFDNSATKSAAFSSDSLVHNELKSFIAGDIYFKDFSAKICEHLLEIIKDKHDIETADILIVSFETRIKGGKRSKETLLDNEYLAILKLNHSECFTHKVDDKNGEKDNQIVKISGILPMDIGKVEEACIIPYDPMIIKLIEKPHLIDGLPTFYFSQLFLQAETELSKKEIAEAINEITEELNDKYFNSDTMASAKMKVALLDEVIEEEGSFSVSNVANKIFEDNEEAKKDFIDLAYNAGIKPDLELTEKFIRQQFGFQKFKASNGVELKFPAELSEDSNSIEFINNDDGTVSIMLKNLRRHN